MKRLLHPRPLTTNGAALLLRLLFGSLFVWYGYTKVAGFQQMAAAFPDYIGIGGRASLILVIFAELVCGFFVLIGFLTRLSVIPIFITMVVAYFVAHAADPLALKQIALVHIVLCPVIFLLGSGRYSVDGLLFRNSRYERRANPRYSTVDR